MHTTVFQVPAHTRINVTIYQYDSGSPLRNQQLGQVSGTYGNVASLNGKPFRVINSNDTATGWATPSRSPSLGINVPLYGNNSQRQPVRRGAVHDQSPHNIIRFSFTSPGPGSYRWQCFVPCGLGLPLRQRGADADPRLHGRLHEGGGVSDRAPAAPSAASADPRRRRRRATSPTTGGG